ncbi:MAG: histidine--tRNA ligase [Bacteroidota bacterium]|nr:histidine--tRNA ligase [Bacteroidota bacterium]
MSKPSLPKGTRDFSAQELAKRNYIIDIIKNNFECFGFQPIETPSFENLETLTGKYGEEGDRLIFKILNSGDFLSKVDQELLLQKESSKITSKIAEKALRYDLTVPFARYVVQNQSQISFPFKRYQIQPVWRADRPQKGRFREFYQCDADVVGSDSLWQEVELIQLYDKTFTELGLTGTVIKINNRKILSAIAQVAHIKDKLIDFTVALDKLDKIGKDGVENEMLQRGISSESIAAIQPLFTLQGALKERVEQINAMVHTTEEGRKGIEELTFIIEALDVLGLESAVLDLDITLARGLNYYTGTILEVKAPNVAMGSIGGGGRYDDLTSIFGLKNMSGIGISFGLDRIYLAMEELGLFPDSIAVTSQILFANMGHQEAIYSLKMIKEFRALGFRCELYPDKAKLAKQIQFADKKNIKYVVVVGTQEMEAHRYNVKNLQSGEQQSLSKEELINALYQS